MWKTIAANEHTWVRFKAHFQEALFEREELDTTEGESGYGRANNVKHGDMEDAFMKFALTLTMAARDASFTELTTSNGNLTTKLRNQKDQIWSLQEEMCNLRVAAAVQTTEVKGPNKG